MKVGELVSKKWTLDIEAFWTRVGENLSIGKMRLLFVADEMPMHLQRVVEFLNKYMSPIEVLAVEIKQFEGSNLKTLVPRVLGQTVQTQQKTYDNNIVNFMRSADRMLKRSSPN